MKNTKRFKNKIIFQTFPSLEAQVAAISDDIAYNNHDLEDGLRANLFTLDDFKTVSIAKNSINKHIKNIGNIMENHNFL